MGRRKLVMEPVKNNNKRKLMFQNRKKSIFKKVQELKTLCEVDISMFICSDEKLEIFHTDPQNVHSLIDLYRQQRQRIGKIESVSDFFKNRNIKIEEELAKMKKKNLEAKYPMWFDFLENFSQGQCRNFQYGLESKIDIVKDKIETIKKQPSNPNCFKFQPLPETPPVATAAAEIEEFLISDFTSKMKDDEVMKFDPTEFYEDEEFNFINNTPSNLNSKDESPMNQDLELTEFGDLNGIGFDPSKLFDDEEFEFLSNQDLQIVKHEDLNDLGFDPSELLDDEEFKFLLNQEAASDSIMENICGFNCKKFVGGNHAPTAA